MARVAKRKAAEAEIDTTSHNNKKQATDADVVVSPRRSTRARNVPEPRQIATPKSRTAKVAKNITDTTLSKTITPPKQTPVKEKAAPKPKEAPEPSATPKSRAAPKPKPKPAPKNPAVLLKVTTATKVTKMTMTKAKAQAEKAAEAKAAAATKAAEAKAATAAKAKEAKEAKAAKAKEAKEAKAAKAKEAKAVKAKEAKATEAKATAASKAQEAKAAKAAKAAEAKAAKAAKAATAAKAKEGKTTKAATAAGAAETGAARPTRAAGARTAKLAEAKAATEAKAEEAKAAKAAEARVAKATGTKAATTSKAQEAKEAKAAKAAEARAAKAAEAEAKKAATAKRRAEASQAKQDAANERLAKRRRLEPRINSLPTQRLNVYAFGTGDNSELGLGPEPNAKIVKRPRLSKYLLPDKVGVVTLAAGGMHALALTHKGEVYSWGVNDQCALGRDTSAGIPKKKSKASDESGSDSDAETEQSEEGLNVLECTPGLVEGFPEETVITQIVAGDSISAAVTDTGKVYTWGTFRCADGILGHTPDVRVQPTPVLLPGVKNVVKIAAGNDHILALSKEGKVFAWGNGGQFQLGRRVVERTRLNALKPREFGLSRRKVKYVAAGSYHSFAITEDGKVWAWGLNQFGQCGIYDEAHAGDDNSAVSVPTVIPFLEPYTIVHIAAGEHHSAALTDKGDLLMWGRLDAHQLGIDAASLPQEDIVLDVAGKPRYLSVPHLVKESKFTTIASGTHHNVAIALDGSPWSWGFGESYQTGHGPPGDDVKVPTKIENTATRGIKMVYAGAGGHFSLLGGIPPEPVLTDGAEPEPVTAQPAAASLATVEAATIAPATHYHPDARPMSEPTPGLHPAQPGPTTPPSLLSPEASTAEIQE